MITIFGDIYQFLAGKVSLLLKANAKINSVKETPIFSSIFVVPTI
jgi:hypothetical protein